MRIEAGTHPEDTDDWLGVCYSETIKQLKNTISCVGVEAEQLLKIDALLILARLCDSDEEQELRRAYFYDAVEIARRYLGPDFYHTQIGAEIMHFYLSIIEPRFSRLLPPEDKDF